MARYIDADELVNWLKRYNQCCNYSDWDKTLKARYSAVNYVIRQIEDEERFPAADVAEVKHGEWIGEYEETCSECGRSISEILDDGSYYSTEFNIKEFIACPYCGAKMDGNV